MGSQLPKPVESTVVERHESDKFQVGVAEMNGWRTSMEDAHLVMLNDTWGVFGVFDGHGGGACSEFAARRLREEIEKNGCPADDATVKKLFLSIDQEFLDSEQTSGSTATMCIVRKPSKAGDKHLLHVINAGDSRVLLGRRDGTIVDGGGTDKGLTVDHKPDHPDERKRIERNGGKVEMAAGGVARVNGNLAVSRGFGDKDEKKTGGESLEERPVTADPEMGHFECDDGDFLLLVCDGVSEGEFPNPEVVKMVAGLLKEGKDMGEAAKAVCHKAVETDSKDNITCMGVLLTGAPSPQGKRVEFNPGPITHLGNKGFRTAYTAMAEKAGLSLAEAAAQRYAVLEAELKASPTDDLREEQTKIGGPPTNDRTQWFEKWLQELPEEKDSGPGGMDMETLSQMMGKGGGGGGKGGGKGGGSKAIPLPPPAATEGSQGKGYAEPAPAAREDEDEKQEGGYAWSQKGEEVQVTFKLPEAATKKDVKVSFKQSSLSVAVQGNSLLDGLLQGKVDTDECTWCLASGGTELQVMLTKQDDNDTWKGLLK